MHEYQAAIYSAVALLNAKSAQERGFQRHQESPGSRAGYLDAEKQIKYSFHGAGCLVSTPAFVVDFDYAQAGGCTGIDTGFMLDFLKNNPAIQAKYYLLVSVEQVEHALQELTQEGVLVKNVYAEYDQRYYLAASIGSPHLPSLALHPPDEAATE